jgi:hypothetical protein
VVCFGLVLAEKLRASKTVLFPADIPGCGFVGITTRRLCTINTRAPFNHVEVYLQNALFAEDEFGHRDQCRLYTLAQDRTARSEE